MKVAAIQHDIVWEDPTANFARLAPRIADAAAAGARLVVLTEMYSTGFSMDTARVAEPVDGPSARFLVDQAIEHGVWMCGSVPEVQPGDERPANTLVLAAPDGAVHRYRKIHPFTYGGEHEQYAAGDQLVTVDIDGVRCSLFVCYDLRFADEFWGLAPDTDCYVVVANWPSAATGTLAHAGAGAGDREPGVRRRREPGRSRRASSTTRATARSSGRSARSSPSPRTRSRRLCSPTSTPRVVARHARKFPFLPDRRLIDNDEGERR